ncbi:MAG: virulence RhuM family protein, partial [Kiritimatiellae bacterium]|nr:virulence RhuM family protein [Kiritimatiellia bacterium]
VRLENETVWLTQAQLCELFQRDVSVISRHIKNIFSEGELEKESNLHFLQIANSDRPVALYSLDVIISVGYRVKSVIGTRFRQWANKVLKEYILRGYAVNERLERLERKVIKHDEQINLVLQTALPPIQGVFYEGQLWDACSLVEKLIGRAKKEIVLIDSWVGPGTLDMLAKKRKGVVVEVVTSPRGNKLAQSDVDKFNAQYGGLMVKTSLTFHDRFLIIDGKELYLIGASLKDLGRKCFGFTKMDAGEIAGIRARV